MAVNITGTIYEKKKSFMSRQNGGGSCMIWAGTSMFGRSEIVFLEGISLTICTFVL
ncbi:hypothetical protein THRCLA_23205 [Thraustotheca clavata]|uniref:Uncharacterized protein n=1 Tax=Thraustotheca clavata TaxID=74557 RepID=A0A1V9Y9V8_9STRA|nr:hypothetical protein THRCLA_23205 [Thraustotheca clavata]